MHTAIVVDTRIGSINEHMSVLIHPLTFNLSNHTINTQTDTHSYHLKAEQAESIVDANNFNFLNYPAPPTYHIKCLRGGHRGFIAMI